MHPKSPTLGRRTFALYTLGVVLFTIYGSFVPFHARARPWNETVDSFRWAMENRAAFQSRSDGLANWLLGVPLGFFALGYLRTGKPDNVTTAIVGGLLVPLCASFAAIIEFLQLYFPARTCSSSDIVAQTIGALSGVLLWVFAGSSISMRAKAMLDSPTGSSNSVRFAAVYAAMAIFTQWLPLDFSASPADVYRRFKYPELSTVRPFEELKPLKDREAFPFNECVQKWIELAAIFLPMGLLVSGLPARLGWKIAGVLAFTSAAELGQLTVTRYFSTTDILISTTAVFAGWGVARFSETSFAKRFRTETALLFGQIWFFALIPVFWHPYDFRPGQFIERFSELEWWPLAQTAHENYLSSLEKVLVKFVLFVPLGIIAAWQGSSQRFANAFVSGIVITFVFELGQMMIAGRYGSPTDLLIGGLGAWIGAKVISIRIGAESEKVC